MSKFDEPSAPSDVEDASWKCVARFHQPVTQFLEGINEFHWLVRAGERDVGVDNIVWIPDAQTAKLEYRRLLPLTNGVFVALGAIAETIGRGSVMQAAEDLWITHFDPKWGDVMTLEDVLGTSVHSQLVGALRELVLDDVVSIKFFREAVSWYERGHFLCGVDEVGRRIVW